MLIRLHSKRQRIKMEKINIIAIIAILLLAACQPTPEESIVIARDNTEKEVYDSNNNVEEGESSFIYKTPQHITNRYTVIKGSLDMAIDADVSLPDIERVPVAKIASNHFTQEKIDDFVNYFAEGAILVNEYIMTKADYDIQIVEAKRGHLVDGEYVYDETSEEWVKQLIEERESAPDEDIQEPIAGYIVSEDKNTICRIKKDGEIIGKILISGNDGFRYFSETSRMEVTERLLGKIVGEENELLPYQINMTEQEAIKIAQTALQDLEIEGMTVADINNIYFISNKDMHDIEYGGYKILFMREFGGMMPLNITSFGKNREDKFEVSPPVKVERIMVGVDEYGNVTSFLWENPITILETLTEHVDILPFADIMTRFKEFSKIQLGYIGGNLGNAMCVNEVYKIELKLMYLPLKNNPKEFMYAPCWIFTYKERVEYTQEQQQIMESLPGYWEPQWEDIGESYLIFSAIDGASVSAYPADWLGEMND